MAEPDAPARCWPRCSTTTGARRSRPGGSASTGRRCPSRSCSRMARRWAVSRRPRTSRSRRSGTRQCSRSASRPGPQPPPGRRRRSPARRPGVRGGDSRARPTTSRAWFASSAARTRTGEPLPRALGPPQPFDDRLQREAIARVARSTVAGDGRYAGRGRPARRCPAARPGHGAGDAAPVRARGPGGGGPDRRLPRPLGPRRPGAARLGQDLDRRADHRRADSSGAAGRRGGHEPQGHPQPARRRSSSAHRRAGWSSRGARSRRR